MYPTYISDTSPETTTHLETSAATLLMTTTITSMLQLSTTASLDQTLNLLNGLKDNVVNLTKVEKP